MGLENIFEKDKDAELDYTVDWTLWLGTDDISSVTWIVPTGITEENVANNTKIATIWLSGGSLGETYQVVCRMETAAGRKDDRTLFIKIVEK